MTDASPKAFISYSHDSDEHRQRVLRLSERLRDDGVETRLDQYEQGTRELGWPRWMLDQLDWAEFVLVVCTATYYRRFRGHEVPDSHAGWQHDLSVSHIKVGLVAERQGECDAARQEYAAAVAISERLTQLDPTNAMWRNDLAWLHERLEAL
ncbi:MAG: TIR domain-containing protein [Planctomycetota bacterium]|nr:TIR domain-containing protein [Planctomycetota bacterium]